MIIRIIHEILSNPRAHKERHVAQLKKAETLVCAELGLSKTFSDNNSDHDGAGGGRVRRSRKASEKMTQNLMNAPIAKLRKRSRTPAAKSDRKKAHEEQSGREGIVQHSQRCQNGAAALLNLLEHTNTKETGKGTRDGASGEISLSASESKQQITPVDDAPSKPAPAPPPPTQPASFSVSDSQLVSIKRTLTAPSPEIFDSVIFEVCEKHFMASVFSCCAFLLSDNLPEGIRRSLEERGGVIAENLAELGGPKYLSRRVVYVGRPMLSEIERPKYLYCLAQGDVPMVHFAWIESILEDQEDYLRCFFEDEENTSRLVTNGVGSINSGTVVEMVAALEDGRPKVNDGEVYAMHRLPGLSTQGDIHHLHNVVAAEPPSAQPRPLAGMNVTVVLDAGREEEREWGMVVKALGGTFVEYDDSNGSASGGSADDGLVMVSDTFIVPPHKTMASPRVDGARRSASIALDFTWIVEKIAYIRNPGYSDSSMAKNVKERFELGKFRAARIDRGKGRSVSVRIGDCVSVKAKAGGRGEDTTLGIVSALDSDQGWLDLDILQVKGCKVVTKSTENSHQKVGKVPFSEIQARILLLEEEQHCDILKWEGWKNEPFDGRIYSANI